MASVQNNNDKVKVTVSHMAYKDKDHANKFVGMTKRIHATDDKQAGSKVMRASAKEIAELWTAGHTITPAEVTGSESQPFINDNSHVSQQVFAVDIDDHLTIEAAKQMTLSKGFAPSFIYTSFSHTPEHHKFRVVYILDKPVDTATAREVIQKFMSLFTIDGKSAADQRCKDVSRLYHGGKNIVYKNYDSVIDLAEIQTVKIAEGMEVKKQAASTKTAKTTGDQAEQFTTPQVNALKSNDLATLHMLVKEAIEHDPTCKTIQNTIPKTASSAYGFVSKLPLHHLLGVQLDQPFRCLMPGHFDKNPSANVKQLDNGKYVYNCYGCCHNKDGQYTDTLAAIQKLTGYGISKTMLLIEQIFDVELETKWQRDMKRRLDIEKIYIESDTFGSKYPLLFKELTKSNSYGLWIFLIESARSYLQANSFSGDDRPTFFMSISEIGKRLSARGYTGTNKSAISRKLNYLCRLGLIKKISDSELRPEVLNKAREIQRQNGQSYRYRQDFLCIPDFSDDLFQAAEDTVAADKDNGVRRQYQSREMIARTYSSEDAAKAFIQDADKELSDKVDAFYEQYRLQALTLIDQQGYTFEKEITANIDGLTDGTKKMRSAQILPQLLQEYSLDRITLNKAVRQQYNVPASVKSGTRIIVKTN